MTRPGIAEVVLEPDSRYLCESCANMYFENRRGICKHNWTLREYIWVLYNYIKNQWNTYEYNWIIVKYVLILHKYFCLICFKHINTYISIHSTQFKHYWQKIQCLLNLKYLECFHVRCFCGLRLVLWIHSFEGDNAENGWIYLKYQ